MTHSQPNTGEAGMPLAPRQVSLEAPWTWLAAGWRDMGRTPLLSLGYGVIFAAVALVLLSGLFYSNAIALFLPLIGGFLLIGPLAAVGLYDASRRLALGQAVTVRQIVLAPLRAPGQLMFFGAILAFAFMVWMRIALILFMLFFGRADWPPAADLVQTLIFTPHGIGMLVVGSLVGFVLAALIFALSALAVPMLLVRRTDAVSAIMASLAGVRANVGPMVLWAVLIAGLIGAGFATLLIGFVLAFPLIGHATWHAYVDIYGDATSSLN